MIEKTGSDKVVGFTFLLFLLRKDIMVNLNTYLQAGETTFSNLIMAHYHQLGMDEFDLIVYLQVVMYQQQGKAMPDLNQIARHMNCPVEVVYQRINHLIQLGVMSVETTKTEEGKKDDYYDVNAIYNLIEETEQKTPAEQVKTHNDLRQQLFQMIESEVGRPLSAIEIDQISQWISVDHYPIEMIQLAFREAILNGAQGPLKYADRILLTWEKEGINTVEAAQQEIERRRQQTIDHHLKERTNQPKKTIPIINSWK